MNYELANVLDKVYNKLSVGGFSEKLGNRRIYTDSIGRHQGARRYKADTGLVQVVLDTPGMAGREAGREGIQDVCLVSSLFSAVAI